MQLNGKVTLITGAGSGIGFAARGLALVLRHAFYRADYLLDPVTTTPDATGR